jgi:chromosome partitioning protein
LTEATGEIALKTIVLANAKGGTGKTTAALNLSAGFASHYHKRVLAIDLDPQGNLAVGLGVDPRAIQNTSFRLLLNDQPNINDYIIQVRPNLDLIPNSLEPAMESQLAARRNRERLLDIRLRGARERYDFIVIDTPPALETATINAMVAADEVIIVIDSGYYALYGLTQLMETLASVQRDFEKHDLVVRALLNAFDQRQKIDREAQEEVENFFESLMLQTIIHKNVKLAEAAAAGKPIHEYNQACSGHFDFMKLSKELMDIYGRRTKVEKESTASRNS